MGLYSYKAAHRNLTIYDVYVQCVQDKLSSILFSQCLRLKKRMTMVLMSDVLRLH